MMASQSLLHPNPTQKYFSSAIEEKYMLLGRLAFLALLREVLKVGVPFPDRSGQWEMSYGKRSEGCNIVL